MHYIINLPVPAEQNIDNKTILQYWAWHLFCFFFAKMITHSHNQIKK